jgi:DNA-binding transcriptional regulator YdaS (Cro superfamily)
MDKADAIKWFGNGAALARALGVSTSAVSQWDEIPLDRQCQIEVLTGGRLEADRSRITPPSWSRQRASQ